MNLSLSLSKGCKVGIEVQTQSRRGLGNAECLLALRRFGQNIENGQRVANHQASTADRQVAQRHCSPCVSADFGASGGSQPSP